MISWDNHIRCAFALMCYSVLLREKAIMTVIAIVSDTGTFPYTDTHSEFMHPKTSKKPSALWYPSHPNRRKTSHRASCFTHLPLLNPTYNVASTMIACDGRMQRLSHLSSSHAYATQGVTQSLSVDTWQIHQPNSHKKSSF